MGCYRQLLCGWARGQRTIGQLENRDVDGRHQFLSPNPHATTDGPALGVKGDTTCSKSGSGMVFGVPCEPCEIQQRLDQTFCGDRERLPQLSHWPSILYCSPA
jgi:hypothetical protein